VGLAAEIENKFGKGLDEIQRKYSGPVPPPPNTFTAQILFRDVANESDAEGIAEWLHFERHRVTMKADLDERQKGSWPATQRVLRTANDLERLRCGKKIYPFKGDLEHSCMFRNLWGFGLEKLTPEELADLFDLYCPCGCEGHDPDSLKKQRNRFRDLLEEVLTRKGTTNAKV